MRRAVRWTRTSNGTMFALAAMLLVTSCMAQQATPSPEGAACKPNLGKHPDRFAPAFAPGSIPDALAAELTAGYRQDQPAETARKTLQKARSEAHRRDRTGARCRACPVPKMS